MKTIKIQDFPKNLPDTFSQIRPTSGYYQLMDQYKILEFGTENYIRTSVLAHIEFRTIDTFTAYDSFTLKGVDLETFREMLKLWNRPLETSWSILIFSTWLHDFNFYKNESLLFKERMRMEGKKLATWESE